MLSQQGLSCEYLPGRREEWLWFIIRYFEVEIFVEMRRVKANLNAKDLGDAENVKASEAAHVCHLQHTHHSSQREQYSLKE